MISEAHHRRVMAIHCAVLVLTAVTITHAGLTWHDVWPNTPLLELVLAGIMVYLSVAFMRILMSAGTRGNDE